MIISCLYHVSDIPNICGMFYCLFVYGHHLILCMFFHIICMFISYFKSFSYLFSFNLFILYSYMGALVFFIVIMCRDGTYKLHVDHHHLDNAYSVMSLGH